MEYSLNPDNFNPKHEASGCIIECKEKILLLKRKTNKSPSGFFWAIPAGKLEKGESPEEALKREIKEEAGIELKDFEKIGVFSMRLYKQGYDFIYHLYKSRIENNSIVLSKEHVGYKWADKIEIKDMDLETAAELYLRYI